MADYISKEEYLAAVKRGIRWKKAREAATRELSDHIDDLCDKYAADGTEKDKAMEKALREMGDADMVADGLDRAYRPKNNYPLIFTVFLMLIAGIGLRAYVFPGGVPVSEIFAVVIGTALAAVLYFGGCALIVCHARLCYLLLSGITALCLFLELKDGEFVYHYSFYLLLFLIFTYIFFMVYMIKHKWISKSACTLIAAAVFTAMAALAFFGIIAILLSKWEYYNFYDQTVREGIFNILRGASLTGGYTGQEAAIFENWSDTYPLIYLAANYGTSTVIVTLIIYAALIFLIIWSARRRNAPLSSLISHTVAAIMIYQLFSGILCNFGLLSAEYMMMTFPFMTGGGSYAFFELFLMGIMLSAERNEDIIEYYRHYKIKIVSENARIAR